MRSRLIKARVNASASIKRRDSLDWRGWSALPSRDSVTWQIGRSISPDSPLDSDFNPRVDFLRGTPERETSRGAIARVFYSIRINRYADISVKVTVSNAIASVFLLQVS